MAFKNRVEKNLKQLKKWRAKEGIEAYRVYDADLPDFAIAVDHYGDWLHVQEYAAPKSAEHTHIDDLPGLLMSAESAVILSTSSWI